MKNVKIHNVNYLNILKFDIRLPTRTFDEKAICDKKKSPKMYNMILSYLF